MLGLIVGETNLPRFIINKLLKSNVKFLILDLTKSNVYKKYINSFSLKITELGKAISILKKNNCKSIIFLGKVKRPEISELKFKTYGCGSAIASSSLVTEWLKGKTLDQASEIKNSAIAEELALPPVKIHCSVLAEDAIKSAIADLKSKQGK